MQRVRAGIDRRQLLNTHLKGARLGLVTNNSGIAGNMLSTIEVLQEGFCLSALFAPEHGIRGELGPGDKVEGGTDKYSGIACHSLFTDFLGKPGQKAQRIFEPPPEALEKIDIMVFDIQDVGSRYYTYPSTLYYVIKACGKYGKKLVVLDRPNPLGGLVLEGNTSRPELLSFIGLTQTPIRHGWTIGELAMYYNGQFNLGCEVQVIPMDGWQRGMYFDETGLLLVRPSPNLPSLDSIVVYNGSCLLAGTNISDGRGGTMPFNMIGAPFIDPNLLSKEMNGIGLEGLAFTPAFYIPAFSKYQGQVVSGVQIHVTDKKAVRAVELGVWLIRTIQRLYPEEFKADIKSSGDRYHLDIASGSAELRENKLSPREIIESWNMQAEAFRPMHDKYRIY